MSQGGSLKHDGDDGGHGDAGEPCLVEMSEVEYTQFQHLLQVQMGTQGATPDVPDAKSHPATVMEISPVTTTQAIDLSTSTEEHWVVMPGEKTPVSNSEVPGYVMARIRSKYSPNEPYGSSGASAQKRSRPAARVCLEKRFNTIEAPRQQDIQSAVFNRWASRARSHLLHV